MYIDVGLLKRHTDHAVFRPADVARLTRHGDGHDDAANPASSTERSANEAGLTGLDPQLGNTLGRQFAGSSTGDNADDNTGCCTLCSSRGTGDGRFPSWQYAATNGWLLPGTGHESSRCYDCCYQYDIPAVAGAGYSTGDERHLPADASGW